MFLTQLPKCVYAGFSWYSLVDQVLPHAFTALYGTYHNKAPMESAARGKIFNDQREGKIVRRYKGST